jgi:ABC-type branched-subunit amino acid transport system substrate-binding protein
VIARTLVILLLAGSAAGAPDRGVTIGAVYPTGGSQGEEGLEEFRGVRLAADYINGQGGWHGRPIRLHLAPANSWDAAPLAVERLHRAGTAVVMGSYGSTISYPAAETAAQLGLVFWETGAVGELGMAAAAGRRVFRFAPTGTALGRAAVAFVRDQLTPRVRHSGPLRYTVTYVDDVYGRAVGRGAIAEITGSHLTLAATLPYDLRRVDYADLAAQIAAAKTDVLVVVSYLEDAVSMRQALLRAKVRLVAGIGTSSSYCHLAFGELLGPGAVGLFASDKPDGDVLRTDTLTPEAGRALRWAKAEYRAQYGAILSAPTLAGFAGGLALFAHVLPLTRRISADEVARAALQARVPKGGLPNGAGLEFASSGPDAGANLRATSVIWEWIRPRTRAVVWPSAFATHPIVFPASSSGR